MDTQVAVLMLLILIGFTLNWVIFKVKIMLVRLGTALRIFLLRVKFMAGMAIAAALLLLFGASAAW